MKVLLLSVILLIIMLLTSCKEVIMHNLDEAQANKVSIILHEYNIGAEKVKSGNNWNILVDSKQASSALQILDKKRFLKRLSSKPKEGKNGLMVSREERQRWLEREQAFNLEETLEAVPEILEARIHFYFSQPNDFDLASQYAQRTASVLLVIGSNNKSGNKPETLKELAVKLISGATGIKESAISIVVASEATFPLLNGGMTRAGMPTVVIFVCVVSVALFFGVSFVIRKRIKKTEHDEESDVIERMEKYNSVPDGEINITPPVNTGDLKGFRYMNRELF